MADQPTVVTDEAYVRRLVREEVATAVKSALADVPARTEVKHLIEVAIKEQSETFGKLLRSVDEHLRQYEYNNSQTRSAVDRMAGVLDGVAQTVKASAAHLDHLQDDVSEQGELITIAHNRIDKHTKAVFGDPETPGVVSLTENINMRRIEAQSQHQTITNKLAELDAKIEGRLGPLERFVTSRQQFEARLVKTIQFAIKHRVALGVALGILGGGVTVGSIDQLLQFLSNLATTLQGGGQ